MIPIEKDGMPKYVLILLSQVLREASERSSLYPLILILIVAF